MAKAEPVFNPQRHFAVRWPAAPVVAMARVDQLARTRAREAELRAALGAVQTTLEQPAAATDRDALARLLGALAASVSRRLIPQDIAPSGAPPCRKR